ncbi:MAG: hypothetical protein EOO01_43945 [Chitinophagaceae bacterium]|nr:MAG: hypothetical protein EOO01_43945 [Chitinophagaceae bacterium]
MFKSLSGKSAILASTALLIYTMLINFEAAHDVVIFLFVVSPIIVILLVIGILKDEDHVETSLKDGEEWGYRNRNKEDLGVF